MKSRSSALQRILAEGTVWRLRMAGKTVWSRVTIVVSERCYLIVDRDHEWKLEHLEPKPQDQIKAEVVLDDGLYELATEFMAFGPDTRRVIVLRAPSACRHVQRRQDERLPLLLDGRLSSSPADELRGVLVRDLSCGGAKIMAGSIPPDLREGSLVNLGFHTSTSGDVALKGQVCRLMERPRGYEVGIAFDSMVADTWKQLATYISDIRQDRVRRGLL